MANAVWLMRCVQERKTKETDDEKHTALLQEEAQLQQHLATSKTEQTALRRQVAQLEKKVASQKQESEMAQHKVRRVSSFHHRLIFSSKAV